MQAEAYSALIEPLVDSLEYVKSMTLDVLGYSIILRLATRQNKIKVTAATRSYIMHP